MDMNRLLEGFFGAGNAAPQDDGATPGGANNPLAGLGASDLARGLGLGGIPGGLGGVAAGGVIGLLLGNRKARKVAGKAVTYGGLAAVAALAYRAWQNSRGEAPVANPHTPPALPPADSGFDPATLRDGEGSDFRLTLLKAMIAAASADGHIDAAERAMLQQQIEASALAADEKAFLFDQMTRPSDPVAVARLATDDKQAAEIYLASSLAIDPDTPEEQRYLERLGDALRLDTPLRTELDRQAAAARQA
ncbi:DUF533 domain-containing protein [Chelativorans sp. ZYF759]|uniref:tellurite resistance TerB family protein n=1 Tax=Chelativorans sp. ZYF759 TaxID=2692213 RepID=UPI00145CE278|nr:tellurite resistance TerB family protein [Chelativorans sp. ZYF759]NMG41011.1 DUF533 domain-containing protein [Chelativorans sp. ZYF759]